MIQSRTKTMNRKGFTLVEMLVVVLVLAILMSVALPLYLGAVADAQRKACRANMQTIANAVLAWKIRTLATDYSTVITGTTTTGITQAYCTSTLIDLQAPPVCPNGGLYTIVNGTSTPTSSSFKVSCSATNVAGAHGTFEPGVNSN